jgi:hypothetical protein
MLNRLPAAVPPLSLILADLGHPHPRDVARALGVSPRTVYTWQAADQAPRTAALSLFWVTRWGQQWLDADLFNAYRLHSALADARGRDLAAMQSAQAPETNAAPGLPQAPRMLFVVR